MPEGTCRCSVDEVLTQLTIFRGKDGCPCRCKYAPVGARRLLRRLVIPATPSGSPQVAQRVSDPPWPLALSSLCSTIRTLRLSKPACWCVSLGSSARALRAREPPPDSFAQTEHLEKVREQATLMKRNVDKNDFKEAVRYAAQMLNELRTGWLSPKTYYELYLEVFSHLSFLEVYFMQLQRGGMPMSELYVSVQHAGTVLVRLYLLITAGSAYLKSGQVRGSPTPQPSPPAPAAPRRPAPGWRARPPLRPHGDGQGRPAPAARTLPALLPAPEDQGCARGRGRSSCAHAKQPPPPSLRAAADKLPDAGTAFEGVGGNVRDAVDVVIRNFGEMNRLWVRMQVRERAATGYKKPSAAVRTAWPPFPP